jgi:outer membrane protein TolC
LEVADANVQLFDAEVAAIRARYTLAIAYLDLRAAFGLDALGQEPKR